MTRGTVALDGLDLAYEIRGQGDWLLMINGIGAAHESWGLQIDDLSRRFRCLMFDNRGVGASGAPPGPYSTAAMADDAAGLMAALGIGRAHVLGVSMGGAIAQQLAIRHPARVDRLAVVCSWAACDRYLARCFEILRGTAERAGRVGPGWSIEVQRFLSVIAFAMADFRDRWEAIEEIERAVADAAARGMEQRWDAFVAQADACLSHDTRDVLARIAAPTLVLAADRDAFTPIHLSEALADAIPGATLQVMRDCGHVMFYERPAEFNERVADFLSGETWKAAS